MPVLMKNAPFTRQKPGSADNNKDDALEFIAPKAKPMTLIPITATQTGLVLGSSEGGTPERTIALALADVPQTAPVVIMVHGKGYRPSDPDRDPHRLIFAPRPGFGRSRFVSWPRRLGFALPGPRKPLGLCFGFGWHSAGALWRATESADATALMLARLVQLIRRIDPERRVDLIGHSLGARVILGAMPLLAANTIDRVILLAGADFTHRAEAARRSPAGLSAEFLNITTRENDLYDFLFERAFAPFGGQNALGNGVGMRENWLDIQLDNPATSAALRTMGLPLAASQARICHWSVYLRPGVFRFYRALLHDRQRLSLPLLRAALTTAPEPRWSHLIKRIAPLAS